MLPFVFTSYFRTRWNLRNNPKIKAHIPGRIYTHGKKKDMIKQTNQISKNGTIILLKDAYPVFSDTSSSRYRLISYDIFFLIIDKTYFVT